MCLLILGTSNSPDDMDDCAEMDLETVIKYLKQVWTDMRIIYGETYLNRSTTVGELGMIEQHYAAQGFRGGADSVDCTNLRRNYLTYIVNVLYQCERDGHLENFQAEVWIGQDLYV